VITKNNPLSVGKNDQGSQMHAQGKTLLFKQHESSKESIALTLGSSIKNLEKLRSNLYSHHCVSRQDLISTLVNAEIMIRYARKMAEKNVNEV
jgi:hypothetical protein